MADLTLNSDHHVGLMLTTSVCGLLPFGLQHSNATVGTHFRGWKCGTYEFSKEMLKPNLFRSGCIRGPFGIVNSVLPASGTFWMH